MSRRILHLVDASPYVFRAFFSLPDSLRAPDGAPVNAVHGFAAFLLRYLREEEPSHLAVAFDGSLTTSFRNELYPPYKAQRDLPPPELEAQQRACREMAAALGARTLVSDRYEADDLIATLVARLRAAAPPAEGFVVVSSDKDLAQLVAEDVVLYDFARGLRQGPVEVLVRFGVRPDQVVDYLALAGDSVDNIPGVRGVGPKTAAALLGHFGSLDAIYADLGAVARLPLRGARPLAAKLAAERETAWLSRTLATVAADAPLPPEASTMEALRWDGARRDELEALVARLGMGSLAGRVTRWAGEEPAA